MYSLVKKNRDLLKDYFNYVNSSFLFSCIFLVQVLPMYHFDYNKIITITIYTTTICLKNNYFLLYKNTKLNII